MSQAFFSCNYKLNRTVCERLSSCFRLPNLSVAFIMISIHSKENQITHTEICLVEVNLKEHFIKGNSSGLVVCGFVMIMLPYCHYLQYYFLLSTTKLVYCILKKKRKII